MTLGSGTALVRLLTWSTQAGHTVRSQRVPTFLRHVLGPRMNVREWWWGSWLLAS